MAKLTKRRVLDTIELTCNVQDWDAWNDKKGDAERTKVNHLMGLVSVKDCLNTISVFETHYPEGISEVVEEYKEKYAKFREQFIKTYPDDFIAYALVLDLSPLGATKYNPKKDPAEEVKKLCAESTEDTNEEPVESEYKGKTLRELRKLCRERDIEVPSGATADDLIALLEESDESGEDVDTSDVDSEDELEEEEQSENDESSESDEEVDESLSYEEMDTNELRAECKKRGIEFSKNAKAHVLIDLLTEDDKKSEKAEAEESDEEVDELDEILDEEFVDEEIEAAAKDEEETKSAKGKRNKK